MGIEDMIARSKAVEEHRLKLLCERNEYKRKYEDAVHDLVFIRHSHRVMCIGFGIFVVVMLGVLGYVSY